MKIISFGDLYIDYYFNDSILLGICGGKTNANIIANLSKYFKTAFIGVVGNDNQGVIAKKSLEKLGVDVFNVEEIDKETKTFFVSSSGYKTECPYCGRKKSYQGLLFDPNIVIEKINEDDYLIIDNLNEPTLEVLNKTHNKAFIDIGYLGNLMYMSLDEITSLLANRFEIINMNNRVYDYLRKKFSIDSLDLYELLNPKILLITKGKKGADIIYNGILEEKIIEDPVKEVEVSGAGDAFFSEFIRTYLENGEEVNEKMISLSYMRASSISRFVLTGYGARNHIEPLYKINNYHECICKEIEIKH